MECPNCGSEEVTPTSEPDEEGICEYHCDECGEYFTEDCS